MATTQRFILLPARGLEATSFGSANTETTLRTLDHAFRSAGQPAPAITASVGLGAGSKVKVVDSISETGAKLVEMTEEESQRMRAAQPGLRIVPEVFYHPARYQPLIEQKVLKAAGPSVKITLTVVSGATGAPVGGAQVVAFTNYAQRAGADGTANAAGKVSLSLGAASKKLDRLYVFAPRDHWGALRKGITVESGDQVVLNAIELDYVDCVRHFYGKPKLDVGSGVTVGVVDSGVDPHADLNVAGGLNTVTGEDPKDFGDNGGHHGTHVAGIIAARGTAPKGIRGVAPGVTLRSYRVFGANDDGASNFAIAKAIAAAVKDGCDLLNLSLGGGTADDATRSAIADARAAGVLVLAAAGNDDRSPVSFPAADSRCLAVSAMGRKGTFPTGSEAAGDVAAPYGADKKNFIAWFSNVGPEIDLVGPGVGVISTVPDGYAIMSGTSMACPAVTGAAARLLADDPQVLAMPRNQARSDAIAKLVLQAAKRLRFGVTFEGSGMP